MFQNWNLFKISVKDQDYRNAALEDKVSNTISVIGIPKTATMEQVIIKQKSNSVSGHSFLGVGSGDRRPMA